MTTSEVWSALSRDTTEQVLSFLGAPRDLVAAAATSKSLRDAASAAHLWRDIARRKFGADVAMATADLYRDWKSMVADDNRAGALPTMPGDIVPCPWIYNHRPDVQVFFGGGAGVDGADMYYLCLLVAVKFHRPTNELRLYLDVRGETDLRHPISSSIERREIGEDQSLETHHQICEALRWTSELHWREAQTGHFKGYLSYDAANFHRRGKYYFIYADPTTRRSEIRGTRRDYHSVPVFTIREYEYPKALEESFSSEKGRLRYTMDVSPFDGETEEDEVVRWEPFVSHSVLRRHTVLGIRRGKWWTGRTDGPIGDENITPWI